MILVTGGSGFLGSHLADALSDHGLLVTILDSKPSPYLRDDQNFILGDILDQETLDAACKGCSAVYHFAGIADIDECKDRPVETVRYNIEGTVRLLEACVKNKVKRVVFASSAYVYSDAGQFYRCSKQACESYLEVYSELHGLEYTTLRFGSLYGPRSDERNSIHKILKQAVLDKKITYKGTGAEQREFIHVQDAAEISVKILTPEYANSNILVTGIEKIRYDDLLSMVREILQNDVFIEKSSSDRKAHYAITPYNFSPKLGKKLIHSSYIDLGQGLLQCMAHILENKQ